MAYFQFNSSGEDSNLNANESLTAGSGSVGDLFVFNGCQQSVNVTLRIGGTGNATFNSADRYENNRRVDHNVTDTALVNDSEIQIFGLQPYDTFWLTYNGNSSGSGTSNITASTARASTTHGTNTVVGQRVYVLHN